MDVVKLKEKFMDCPYSDDELKAYLSELGYDLIVIEEIVVPVQLKGTSAYRMKRVQMFDEYNKHTLFITLKEDRTVYNMYYKKGHVEGLYDKEEEASNSNSGCAGLIILFIIVVVAIGGIVSCSTWVGDNFDTDYYYDPNDKDKDGDVDYDDVQKYLEDSLEEDENDGDDW